MVLWSQNISEMVKWFFQVEIESWRGDYFTYVCRYVKNGINHALIEYQKEGGINEKVIL